MFEWLIVAALVAGPLAAVMVQMIVAAHREKHGRRLQIFRVLMATRNDRDNGEHLRALNMIDVEYYGRHFCGLRFQRRREKKVVEAWGRYQDYLTQQSRKDAAAEDLFADLLQCLAESLGYIFDRAYLRQSVQRTGNSQLLDQLLNKEGLARALAGDRTVDVVKVLGKLSGRL